MEAEFSHERIALEEFETAFGVNRKTVDGFIHSLKELRRLYAQVLDAPEEGFREGRIVVMGLVNHAYHLLTGGIQALAAGNGVVWSSCVRGLIETFGAGVLISEKPGTVVNHLEQVSPGKLYTAAERGSPGLGGDAKRLHKIVHPASGAIYAGFTVADPAERIVNFGFGLRPAKPDEGREGVTMLANLAYLIETTLAAVVGNPQVLSAGKVVMVRQNETGAHKAVDTPSQ